MRYQLVLQFPFEDDGKFDELVHLENNTDDAETTHATIMPASQIIDGLKVAYRETTSDTFTILWPPDCKDFDIA